MLKINIIKLFILIILLFGSGRSCAEPPIYTDSLLGAIAESQESKKEILVIFTSTRCKYCNLLKTDLENNPEILENIIVCCINYDQNQDLVKEYGVKSIPDCLLIKNMIEVRRKVGYNNLKDFEIWLKKK